MLIDLKGNGILELLLVKIKETHLLFNNYLWDGEVLEKLIKVYFLIMKFLSGLNF